MTDDGVVLETQWWLKVATPGGIHLYPVDEGDGDAVEAAKALHEVPADWDVAPYPPERQWDVSLSPGLPHETLVTRALVHTRDELDGHGDAVLARRAAVEQAVRTDRVARAQAVLAELDGQDLAELMANLKAQT